MTAEIAPFGSVIDIGISPGCCCDRNQADCNGDGEHKTPFAFLAESLSVHESMKPVCVTAEGIECLAGGIGDLRDLTGKFSLLVELSDALIHFANVSVKDNCGVFRLAGYSVRGLKSPSTDYVRVKQLHAPFGAAVSDRRSGPPGMAE